MLARRYYGHDTPEGKTVMDRVEAKGYRAVRAGENIARGQYSVKEVMDGWMGSPVHQEHLVVEHPGRSRFRPGVRETADGYQILWVQDFGRVMRRSKVEGRRSRGPTLDFRP